MMGLKLVATDWGPENATNLPKQITAGRLTQWLLCQDPQEDWQDSGAGVGTAGSPMLIGNKAYTIDHIVLNVFLMLNIDNWITVLWFRMFCIYVFIFTYLILFVLMVANNVSQVAVPMGANCWLTTAGHWQPWWSTSYVVWPWVIINHPKRWQENKPTARLFRSFVDFVGCEQPGVLGFDPQLFSHEGFTHFDYAYSRMIDRCSSGRWWSNGKETPTTVGM